MSMNSSIGLDVSFLRQVAQDPSPYQRMKLGRELAAFVTNQEMPEDERQAVLPILLSLSNDLVASVRRAIAEDIELAKFVPPDLVFAIAADDDDIALPFLAACPSLNAGTLVAIVRLGDEARQCAIARRLELPRQVLAALIRIGNVIVCRTLLANTAISLPIEAYRLIMNRFSAVTPICEAMRKRTDLPIEMRVKLAQINNDRVKVVLAKQGWVEDDRLDDLLSEAEDHSFLHLAHGLERADLEAMIKYLLDNQLISGTLVCRAVCHGEFTFVTEALAQLADMPVRHVWSVLSTRNHPSLQAVCVRANLPAACVSLLHLAMECGAGDQKPTTATAFSSSMIDVLLRERHKQTPEEITAILTLIATYGPEEVRMTTERLIATMPRAA